MALWLTNQRHHDVTLLPNDEITTLRAPGPRRQGTTHQRMAAVPDGETRNWAAIIWLANRARAQPRLTVSGRSSPGQLANRPGLVGQRGCPRVARTCNPLANLERGQQERSPGQCPGRTRC